MGIGRDVFSGEAMTGQYAIRWRGKDLTPRFELATWLWALLIFSYFFLLGFPRLFTLPAAVLIVVGIYQLFRQVRMTGWRGLPDAYRVYGVVFLLLWLPLLISLTDAEYLRPAASDTLKIFTYGFLGLATLWLVREKNILHPVVILLSGLALFWTADVIVQRLLGYDLFGVPYAALGEATRAGAYFKNSGKFGTYLACMDVLALYYLVPRCTRPHYAILLWLFLLTGMFFTLSRTGWLIFMLFSTPLFYIYILRRMRHAWIWGILGGAVGAVLLHAYYQHDPALQMRMARTLAFMNGMTYENWNTALTYRLDLWAASWQMFSAHWFNGLGLHAFTSNFSHYPSAPFWQSVQPSHEHQYLLQIMNATGLIGLLAIAFLHFLLLRLWWVSKSDRSIVLPVAMYLLSMWFPFGTHFSFYSSEWVWANLMLLGLLVGGLMQGESDSIGEAFK
jgi:O-antigen ligase